MNLIKVGNLKVTKAGEVCDRSSVLGNPFVLSTKTEAEREKVIAAYRKYMYRIAVLGRTPEQAIRGVVREHHSRSTHLVVANLECRGRKSFMDELERLETLVKQGEITLLCWCSPLPCHCDKIADYLRWRLA